MLTKSLLQHKGGKMDNNAMYLVMIIIYAITVVFFVIMFNKKDKQFSEERKDLLNRLMAKNTREYIQVSNKEIKQIRPLTDGDILGDDRYDGMLN